MLRVIALIALAVVAPLARAEVVSVEVTNRQPWAGGERFDQVGAYEVLRGTVHYAIDPHSASARDVTDIAYAPVNANGLVEYSGPFVIVRPVDPARGNHVMLVEVANRGRTEMDGLFFESENGLDLMSPADAGKLTDPTFFRLGYSVAWVGWQGRLGADQFGLQVPVASVHSAARATFAADEMTTDRKAFDLPGNGFYCAQDAQQGSAVLRLHTRFDDPGAVVPRDTWRFAAVSNAEARCAIALNAPAAADAYFSLVYEGENASVMGLGEAAFRDFASHLKFGEVASAINDRAGDATAVFAYGYSQGGRFLRDFLFRGFNTGPGGRRVFDGMLVTTAGAGRGSFNHRYALPGEAGSSVMSNLRAVDLYPFADVPTPDVDGSGRAGLLDRPRRDGTVPKLMYVVSSSEYWARNASLLQTAADGTRPLALAPESRLYFFSGVPHALKTPGSFTRPGKEAAYPYNANVDLADGMNAQLENLRAWVLDNVAPPATIAPVLGATLVDASQTGFPAIPGIQVPVNPPPLWQLNLGRRYASQGILDEPPGVGRRYPLLVPAVDADGNDLGGWRGAMSAVPLGTYTGWNWKSPQLARFGFISGLNGAFIPFARTRAERVAHNDPRRSIEERYANRDGFMAAVAKAIDDAVDKRFLLPIQREAILAKMGRHWDDTMAFGWYLGQRADTGR